MGDVGYRSMHQGISHRFFFNRARFRRERAGLVPFIWVLLVGQLGSSLRGYFGVCFGSLGAFAVQRAARMGALQTRKELREANKGPTPMPLQQFLLFAVACCGASVFLAPLELCLLLLFARLFVDLGDARLAHGPQQRFLRVRAHLRSGATPIKHDGVDGIGRNGGWL